MCLPSEAGNGPIICADIHIAAQVGVGVAGDTQPCLERRVGLHVRQDRRVRDCLDETRTEHRRRNAENDVRVAALAGQRVSGRQEVKLGDVATRGVIAADPVVYGKSICLDLQGIAHRAVHCGNNVTFLITISLDPFRFLLIAVSGWINQQQLELIDLSVVKIRTTVKSGL